MMNTMNTPALAIAPENTNNCNPIETKEENTMRKNIYNIDKTIDIEAVKSIRNISKSLAKSKDIFYSNGSKIRKIVEAGLDDAITHYLNGSDLVKYNGRLITAHALEEIINEYNELVNLKNEAEEVINELESELAKYEF